MSEMNSGAVAPSIPTDTRLIGQRPAEAGGAAVPFDLAQLIVTIMGSANGEMSRTVYRATEGFSGRPAAGKESQGLWWTWYGPLSCSHVLDIYSGFPDGPNDNAEHAHLKMRGNNASGPGAGTAGYLAQLIYSAFPDGTSTQILHGYSAEITSTALGSEHSIDTNATVPGAGPGFVGTVKLRHTVNHGLTVGQVVLFEVTGPVAGIQASIFHASVTQAPTLVSGVYETLVQVSKLDANHWKAANKADTASLDTDSRSFFNTRWALKTVAGEINGANKVSMARDTTGPVEQLLITWGTAHGLVVGQSVSVWVSGALTGMTGFWTGFHSGRVEEVVSPTQIRFRARNLRLISNGYSYTGAVTSATSTWAVFAGTLDPHHEINPSTNNTAVYRDNFGRVTRWMGGGVDVPFDGMWGCGTGVDPDSQLFGRGRNLWLGRRPILTMAGSRDPRRGVRSIRNFVAAAALATSPALGAIGTANGAGIGTGEFSVVADVMLEFGGGVVCGLTDTACRFLLRLQTSGDMVLETWDGTSTTSTSLGVSLGYLAGTRGVIAIRRSANDISVDLDGFNLYRGTPTSWGRSVSSAAVVRVGGALVEADRYNGTVFAAWAFAHVITQADMDFISVNGRVPTPLQWGALTLAYAAPFSSGLDGWDSGAVGTTVDFNKTAGGRDGCLEITTLGTTGSHLVTKSVLARAKRFRITLEVFRPAGNTVATGILVQPFNQGSTAVFQQLQADTWTNITVDAEERGTTGNSVALILMAINAANGFSFTGNASDKLYVRNLNVQRLGAVMALDFGAGAGFQAFDQAGNGFHSTLATPFDHVMPETRAPLYFRLTTSGNFPTAGLPAGARITSIIANAISGTPTITVGSSSGGAQHVASVTLAAGRQRLTVVPTGEFSATGALFIGGNATCDVWFTINYEVNP